MRKCIAVVACGLAGILPVAALADQSAPPKPWQGDASLSYIVQNGNSSSSSIYAKGEVIHNSQFWQESLKAEGGSTRSRDNTTNQMVRTAESYYVAAREQRNLAGNNFLFNLSTFLNDNFSGYDYQASDSIGYGRQLINTKGQQLSIEIGPGYRVRKLNGNDPTNPGGKQEAGILHMGLKYAWQLTKSTSFKESFGDDLAKGNYAVRAETSLSTMLNSKLAFRVTHLLQYSSDAPAGSDKTDSQITISLVYSFK